MENEEMLEQTNETENVETQTTEEKEEGIELTDTSEEVEEDGETIETEEKEEVKKSLKELLRENPEYQEEYNNMLKVRLDREDRKHQKELSKYKDTENVLRSTLNLKEDDDTNQKLREFYEAEGVKLPEAVKPGLSTGEIEALARYNAEQIIESGMDEMEAEANRLASKGYTNLNESERIIFNAICEKLTAEKDKESLLKLGAKEDLLKDKEFIDFRKQFNSSVPMEKIYSLYTMNKPKPKAANPGSMKNNEVTGQKDTYTAEEISRLTDEQLDDPKIWEAVRKSMTKNNTSYFN